MKHALIILLIACSLRLYNIESYAEFLGDQGRDAMEIKTLWENKEIPLHGPPNSVQQFQGPIYYYLLALPLIISNFDPLAPTIFFTMLEAATAVVLFILGRKLFGTHIGILMGLLYALSPEMILRSRIFWNPTPIPLFVSVLFLSSYQLWKQNIRWAWILGISLSILIQLHYSGFAYIPLTILFLGIIWYRTYRKERYTHILKVLTFAFLGFLITSFPFLVFEISRGFSDILSIQDSAQFVLSRRSIPLHYIMFLAPIPFIVVGALMYYLNKFSRRATVLIGSLLIISSLYRLPIVWQSQNNDLTRSAFVAETIHNDVPDTPYSFATFSSRSASDLHTRFYFQKLNEQPVDYESDAFNTLYLLCEEGTCPHGPELPQRELLGAKCYEPVCNREYPRLHLKEWKYETSWDFDSARLYKLTR